MDQNANMFSDRRRSLDWLKTLIKNQCQIPCLICYCATLCIARLCCGAVSVCPSVMFAHCIENVKQISKQIFKLFSPSDSPIIQYETQLLFKIKTKVKGILSFFPSFFLLWGSTRSLRMPALRPASQAIGGE